jgi:hypothetical protein
VRSLLAICVTLLAGCATSTDPLPKQPDAPTSQAVVTTLGKDLDKTDHRVGAALVAIERNADKPKVVVAESRLAQSYLPQAPEPDIAFAMARASKGDTPAGALDYKKQMEFGRKLATAVTLAWEKLEADQKEALRVSQLKDARIVELTAEVERVKAQASKDIWSLTGAGLAVIGALAFAFGGGPRVGLPLLLCGAFCGALPHIIDSPAFLYVAIGTAAIASGLFLWWLADKVSDDVQDKKDEAEITKDDEQPPPQV